MRPRQPVPRRWLMTDERVGDALWPALRRLPPGSGVVFRHYATPARARRVLFRRVARVATARRLVLVLAGATAGGAAAGRHGARTTSGLRTASAHRRRAAMRAMRAGADVLFVSPIFPTRSHVGGETLGIRKARAISGSVPIACIALGGMTERRFRRLPGFHGWAAIDAWLQKRKAVPI